MMLLLFLTDQRCFFFTSEPFFLEIQSNACNLARFIASKRSTLRLTSLGIKLIVALLFKQTCAMFTMHFTIDF